MALTGQSVVARIRAIYPEQKQVTLYSIQPGGAVTGGVTWWCIRKNADKDTLVAAGIQADVEHRTFQMLQEAQSVAPAHKNRIVDWNGDAWIIHSIDYSTGDKVFDCLCLKTLS